jgi:protein-tyrosine phosphatase
MIDLHSHILPGIDDGSPSLDVSLEMARIAIGDGIRHMACTPHIMPGVYDNDQAIVTRSVTALREGLEAANLPLNLYVGADVHIAPDLPEKLRDGQIPTLNRSRYFLFEPPHHILPPKIEDLAQRLINAGFVPIVTHPERLTWIASHYHVVERLNELGCLIQLTADSILGSFGRTALLYAERLIDEGRVDIVASDAHGVTSRRPCLSQARAAVAKRVGEEEADKMVLIRPAMVLANHAIEPAALQRRPRTEPRAERFGALGRIFKGGGS